MLTPDDTFFVSLILGIVGILAIPYSIGTAIILLLTSLVVALLCN